MMENIFNPNKRYYPLGSGFGRAFENFRDAHILLWAALLAVIVVLINAMGLQTQANPKDLALAGTFCAGTIIAVLFQILISFKMVGAAMKKAGLKLAEPLPKMESWVVLQIRIAILEISSWYDKKLLAASIALLILAVLAGAITQTPQLMPLLLLPIYLIMFVNQVRLMFGNYYFLQGEGNDAQMPKKSYEFVQGQTMQVALPMIFIMALSIFVSLLYSAIPADGMMIFIHMFLMFIVSWLLAAFSAALMADVFKFFNQAQKKKPAKGE